MFGKKIYRSDMISCVLCYDAPCSKACGKIDSAGLLRSIWFDNEKTAAAEMPAVNPCAGCSAPCERACVKPGQVAVKNLLTRLGSLRGPSGKSFPAFILRCGQYL